MPRHSMFALACVLGLCFSTAQAQDVRYISDKQYIPLRSGAGSDYRIVHRGLPSGTRLTVSQLSEDGVWAQITTAGGQQGWLRAQYLMEEVPAALQLQSAKARNDALRKENETLSEQQASLRDERESLASQVSDTGGELSQVTEELAQLKKISGKAVELDADNRRLTEESETLRSEVDTLKAENRRLQDKLQSGAFIDGALAVLLGVIITLVVPRLWPRRRRSSSWA